MTSTGGCGRNGAGGVWDGREAGGGGGWPKAQRTRAAAKRRRVPRGREGATTENGGGLQSDQFEWRPFHQNGGRVVENPVAEKSYLWLFHFYCAFRSCLPLTSKYAPS